MQLGYIRQKEAVQLRSQFDLLYNSLCLLTDNEILTKHANDFKVTLDRIINPILNRNGKTKLTTNEYEQ